MYLLNTYTVSIVFLLDFFKFTIDENMQWNTQFGLL